MKNKHQINTTRKLRSPFHMPYIVVSTYFLGLLAWITKSLLRSLLCCYIKGDFFKLDEIYFSYIRTQLFYCVKMSRTNDIVIAITIAMFTVN